MSKHRRDHKPDGTFWVSYSDLATALLLVFVLILMVKAADADEKQERLVELEQEVRKLIEQRETVADRLQVAVNEANQELGEEVFTFVDQRVEVTEQDVAWFAQGEATLTEEGQNQLEVFFHHLYDQLLKVDDAVVLPDFLEAIDILGHTDPTWATDDAWTWESYENNLALSQNRALAVVQHVRSLYDAGREQDATRPWKPFVALLNASGRSWTRTYCDLDPFTEPLTADAFHQHPLDPCAGRRALPASIGSDRKSRRVSFGFRLDDRAILEELRGKLEAAGGDP